MVPHHQLPSPCMAGAVGEFGGHVLYGHKHRVHITKTVDETFQHEHPETAPDDIGMTGVDQHAPINTPGHVLEITEPVFQDVAGVLQARVEHTAAAHVLDNLAKDEKQSVEEVNGSIIESLSILMKKDLELFSSKVNQKI